MMFTILTADRDSATACTDSQRVNLSRCRGSFDIQLQASGDFAIVISLARSIGLLPRAQKGAKKDAFRQE